MVTGPVGVLALQGGYQRHADLLNSAGVATRLVRSVAELEDCAALILPGGESTAVTRLLDDPALFAALRSFAAARPLFGTCAGLILMSRVDDVRVRSLNVLDVQVARNAYGRQAQSFRAVVTADLGQGDDDFPGVFIRAPRITRVGPGVTVLAYHAGVPVLVAQGPHLGATFHPELTDDPRIHLYWLARAAATREATRYGGGAP